MQAINLSKYFILMESRIKQVFYMSILTPLLILFIFSNTINNITDLSHLFPNILLISYLTTSIVGFSIQVSSYKERKVFARVLLTPTNLFTFIISMIIAQIFYMIIETIIITILSIFLFHINLSNKLFSINSIGVIILLIIGIVILLLISFFIALISKNVQITSSIANFLNLSLLMISNIFFSVDVFPTYLKTINIFNIVYILQKLLYKINSGKLPTINNLSIILTIMLSYLIIFILLDIKFFKKRIIEDI